MSLDSIALKKLQCVYGFVFAMNRGKPHTLEVLVDTWPAFTTIIVRPDPNVRKKTKGLYDEVLRRMLAVEDAIDWSTYFLIGADYQVRCDLEPRLSVLNESHANVVNKTWKFGGDDKGYRNILNLIRHFPTCCITDENNQPVSWVLLYDYCAMGMLYTQPEHRGKGYAKALVTTMAQRLHSQGYPVYCFIEECNPLSYKLFKSMFFSVDPSYRVVWYEFIC
ncbi:glycine N-acyltransferase-like [Sinocyclocheilus anshuiensis]|uniref:glycine N-acyltransferase-like n=1 Tax=Sinocyclocheilus anshuiensis TaxID=1608454 RepID=UPI0007B93750|nr:PREDICTED: glycine N-acyltransferase-like [Sinocyclocheilus anshuiensis]